MTPELKPAFRVFRRKVLTGLAVGMMAAGVTTVAVSHATLLTENSKRETAERTFEGFMQRKSSTAEREAALTALIGDLIFVAGSVPLLLKLLKETKPPRDGGGHRISFRSPQLVAMEPIPVKS